MKKLLEKLFTLLGKKKREIIELKRGGAYILWIGGGDLSDLTIEEMNGILTELRTRYSIQMFVIISKQMRLWEFEDRCRRSNQ